MILPVFEKKEGTVTVGDSFLLDDLFKEDDTGEYSDFEVVFEWDPSGVSWNQDEGVVTAAAAADVRIVLKAGSPAEEFDAFVLHIKPLP